MHIYEKNLAFSRLFAIIGAILPCLFWGLVIFGFEERSTAICTIFSAISHELGHLGYLSFIKNRKATIKSVSNGFRISCKGHISYKEEMWLYLSGPLVNLIIAFFSFLLHFILGNYFILLFGVNLTTAISNLLPIEGYDGYGVMKSILQEKEAKEGYFALLKAISQSIIFLLCLVSLYLIDRLNGGYWIFAIFFVMMVKQIKMTVCKE